jgi:hypothetical protein
MTIVFTTPIFSCVSRRLAGLRLAAALALAVTCSPVIAFGPQQGLLIAGQGEVGAALANAELLLNASGVAPAVLVIGYGVDDLPRYQAATTALSKRGVLFFVCEGDLADPEHPPSSPVILVTGHQRRIPGQAHIVKEVFNQCTN